MYSAHASYSACGLGADGTDRLVELVRAAGPHGGLHGAKITGGGSRRHGGRILARRGAATAVREIAERYQRGDGAADRGARRFPRRARSNLAYAGLNGSGAPS